MLGVVAEHSAAEHQALAQRAAIDPSPAISGQPFARQTEGVTDRSAEQEADDPIHVGWHSTPRTALKALISFDCPRRRLPGCHTACALCVSVSRSASAGT
jgi:hypothetical protein